MGVRAVLLSVCGGAMLARRMKPCIGPHTHLALGLGKLCFHQTGNKDVGNTYLGGLQCWNRFCFGLSLVFGLEQTFQCFQVASLHRTGEGKWYHHR